MCESHVVLGTVGLNMIIASVQHEDSGGHEPACAWSAHIYIKDRRDADPGQAASILKALLLSEK